MRVGVLLLCQMLATATCSAVFAQEASDVEAKTLSIAGSVVDENDKPVGGVEVLARGYNQWSIAAVTNAEGLFEMEVPVKQAASLSLTADDGTRMGFYQRPWSREPPEQVAPVSITLKPVRLTIAKVVDESSAPVEGARVILQSNYREVGSAITDSDGNTTLRTPVDAPRQAIVAMKEGVGIDYFLYRRADEPAVDPFRLPPNHSESIEFLLNGTRKVKVMVVDQDNQPLEGVSVTPWLYQKPNKGGHLNFGQLFSTTTDEEGFAAFEAPVDQDRPTTVWTRLAGYASPKRANFDPKAFQPVIEARLEKMVSLSGHVDIPDGANAHEITVLVSGSGHTSDDFRGTPTKVKSDGSFELSVNRNMYYQLAAGDNKAWASAAVNVIVRDKPVDGVVIPLSAAAHVHGTVTVEGSGTAVSDQWLQLYQRPAQSYNDLPDEERLPNPTDSRRSVSSYTVRSSQTDKDGRFEFFVGPGSYYILGTRTAETLEFDLESETEKEIDIKVKPVELKKSRIVPGRVVLKDDREQGVAKATLFSYPLDSFSGSHIRATTDAKGAFQSRQILGKHMLHARSTSGDNVLVGLVEISSDDDEYVVPIGLSATLRGRLMEETLDLPLDNRKVRCSVEIEYPNGTSTSAFGGSATTDEEGRFEIDGLVPGRTYQITVTTELDAEGRGRSWRIVDEISAKSPEVIEREFRVSSLDFPPTFVPIE